MGTLLEIESSVLLWIQSIRTPAMTTAFRAVTYLGEMGIFWVAMCLALICFRKHRRAGVMGLIALAAGFIICNLLLKNLVARMRPYAVIEGLTAATVLPGDWSFPSGHATASFAAATAIHLTEKGKWTVWLIIAAALVAVSRVYLGVHYLTDVLAGTLIGVMCAFISVKLIGKMIRI